MSDLNLDHDEARALHRIVRAMHDGECPKCHSVAVTAEDMRRHHQREYGGGWKDGWCCPVCGFRITGEEADAVFQIFAPFMERNLAVFEKWRESRKQ